MKTIDGELIDRIGGNAAVARLCQVTPQAVSQWRTAGIPRARMMYLRVVSPDAFADQTQQIEVGA